MRTVLYCDVVSSRTVNLKKTVETVSVVSPYRAMSADKHIPVTEETRKELHQLKEPGQTYDDLLQELAQQRRRQNLEQRFQDLEDADRDELTSLSDV
jgi:predicted CopG family antitoxin